MVAASDATLYACRNSECVADERNGVEYDLCARICGLNNGRQERGDLDPTIDTDDGNLKLSVASDKGIVLAVGDDETNLMNALGDANEKIAALQELLAKQNEQNAAAIAQIIKTIGDEKVAFETEIGDLTTKAGETDDLAKTNANKIDRNQDELRSSIQTGVSNAAQNAKDDNKALETRVTTSLTNKIEETDGALEKADACTEQGLAWNGEKCVAQNMIVGAFDKLACNTGNKGRLRFLDGLQVCDGAEWGGVGGAGTEACTKEYGSDPCNPATSCQSLGEMGRVPSNGKVFYIGTLAYSSKWKCLKDKNWAVGDVDKTFGGVSYGDGSDGDFDCNKNGVVFINEIFPNYDPTQHRIPQWKSVNIRRNCVLSVANYDGSGNAGGVLAFRVQKTLTVHGGGYISVDTKGNRGGMAPGWKATSGYTVTMRPTGYNSNIESARGEGIGGGWGGKGGLGCCHGSGGGGGSFGRKGGKGSPDKCRINQHNRAFGYNSDEFYAPAGNEHMHRSNFYHPFEIMGSGGGAGGAGHPSMSEAPPQNGGTGAGTMQIMAADYSNGGRLNANGEAGLPFKTYRHWPNSNAQVGSGGAGSGGLIKLITKSTRSAGSTSYSGGAQPLVTNWCQRDHQRGGAGGSGRLVHARGISDQ